MEVGLSPVLYKTGLFGIEKSNALSLTESLQDTICPVFLCTPYANAYTTFSHGMT